MRQLNVAFVPLSIGEKPGDPGLGGWRPLPPFLFTQQQNLVPDPADNLNIVPTMETTIPSLKQVVQLVAARLWAFQLRHAIEIVAQRITKCQ